MKAASDIRRIAALQASQRGVFTTADLRTALSEPHAAAFARRIDRLIDEGVLWRFKRGFYVTEEFDLEVLSQRIAPRSCISFETVLAANLVIGTRPARRVVATKVGPTRTYAARGYDIEHLSISAHLDFGCHADQEVRRADLEKAILDVLYFHLRGRRFPFDVYSDLDVSKLDPERLRAYLSRYRNPKFVAFARRVVEAR